jgi:hypothetical protein
MAGLAALVQNQADSVMISLNVGNGIFQRRADVAAARSSTTLRPVDLDNDAQLRPAFPRAALS